MESERSNLGLREIGEILHSGECIFFKTLLERIGYGLTRVNSRPGSIGNNHRDRSKVIVYDASQHSLMVLNLPDRTIYKNKVRPELVVQEFLEKSGCENIRIPLTNLLNLFSLSLDYIKDQGLVDLSQNQILSISEVGLIDFIEDYRVELLFQDKKLNLKIWALGANIGMIHIVHAPEKNLDPETYVFKL